MSQEELALAIGKSGKHVRNIISNWEADRAEPSMSDIRKLAEVLETTAGWLIDGMGESVNMANEPPPGYSLIPTNELNELLMKVVKQQKTELERQKN